MTTEEVIKKNIARSFLDQQFMHQYYNCTPKGFLGMDVVMTREEEQRLRTLGLPASVNRYYKRTLFKSKLYNSLFSRYIMPTGIVLDGGCGRRTIVRRWWHPMASVIGIDISVESVKANSDVNHKMAGGLEHIPLRSESVDVVRLNGVPEHLRNPRIVYLECYRILKKGGYLLLKTQSIYNPFYFPNAILPISTRSFIVHNMLRCPGQIYPAYYRSNSKRCLKKMLSTIGFQKEFIFYYPAAEWPRSLLMYALFCAYEKMTDILGLEFLKSGLIACFRKI